jgi:hypothetical protein
MNTNQYYDDTLKLVEEFNSGMNDVERLVERTRIYSGHIEENNNGIANLNEIDGSIARKAREALFGSNNEITQEFMTRSDSELWSSLGHMSVALDAVSRDVELANTADVETIGTLIQEEKDRISRELATVLEKTPHHIHEKMRLEAEAEIRSSVETIYSLHQPIDLSALKKEIELAQLILSITEGSSVSIPALSDHVKMNCMPAQPHGITDAPTITVEEEENIEPAEEITEEIIDNIEVGCVYSDNNPTPGHENVPIHIDREVPDKGKKPRKELLIKGRPAAEIVDEIVSVFKSSGIFRDPTVTFSTKQYSAVVTAKRETGAFLLTPNQTFHSAFELVSNKSSRLLSATINTQGDRGGRVMGITFCDAVLAATLGRYQTLDKQALERIKELASERISRYYKELEAASRVS